MTATVDVKTKWDENYSYGPHNVVRVYLDDVAVLKSEYVSPAPGVLSGVAGSFQITSPLAGSYWASATLYGPG